MNQVIPILKKRLKLSFSPYTLELKHVFTVSGNSRSTTQVILTKIEYEGMTGYGEASLPPYLGETQDSVTRFLSKIDFSQFSDTFDIETILDYVAHLEPNNTAAKASVDIALHDLLGKIINKPLFQIWGYNPSETPFTSFTIGMDTPEMVKQKVKEAEPYKIIKVKLGKGNDKEMIETVRTMTDKPIYADINQGWKDKHRALSMAHWLKEKGVAFIEQPMPKDQIEDIAWLTTNSPIPVMADEGIQGLDDLMRFHTAYSGVNIKLMKCGGLREALKMIGFAISKEMKVMIGCMTETSCAISAAAHLTPLADFADLDGSLLIKNDVFEGMKIIDGKITLNDRPGIGVIKLS